MKILFSRFLVAIMIVSTLSIVTPVYAGLGNTAITDDAALNSNQRNIASQCHLDDSMVSAWCCFTDCDIKFAPIFSAINSWQDIHARRVIKVSVIRLHQIYLKPVTPPPIHA